MILLLTVGTVAGGWAEPDLRDDNPGATVQPSSDLAAFAIQGYRSNGERLLSGRFRAEGTRRITSPKDSFDQTVEFSIESAFDNERQRLRFDRNEPPPNPDKPANGYGGQMIKMLDKTVICPPRGSTATIFGPEKKPDRGINPFDVRVIGCVNLIELEAGTRIRDVFDSPNGFLSTDGITEVVENAEIIRVSWRLGQTGAVRTISFDRSSGYCPIRLEDRERLVVGDGYAPPSNTMDMQWRAVGDLWVLDTLRAIERRGMASSPDAPIQTREMYLRFVWENVNGDLPESLFSEWDLKKPNGQEIAGLVDARVSPPLVLRSPEAPPSSFQEPERSRVPMLLWVANLVFLLIVAVVVVIRKRRQNKSAST